MSADNHDEKTWKNMQDAFNEYQMDRNRENKEMLQNAKHDLEKAYVQVEKGELHCLTAEMEEANKRNACKESW